MQHQLFKKRVWDFYKNHGRRLPWRETRDPYKILVSEIMLQQTQVKRVVPKYKSFVKKFPTLEALAGAPLSVVLKEWQGLGYNRRALYLKRTAESTVTNFGGKLPKDYKLLLSLPGIGPATAGDILAFAHNIAVPVIETNIRTVFLHHFFNDVSCKQIHDKEILPLVEKTLDLKNPREWYWALLDYGSYLKKTIGNQNAKSKHYAKQSTFKGSNRELRSKILSEILAQPGTSVKILANKLKKRYLIEHPTELNRLLGLNIAKMTEEGLLVKKDKKLFVA